MSAPSATTSVCLGGNWLAGFGFGAFFQRGLARKFYATLVVNTDAFDPDHVTNFRDIFRSFDPEICQLRDVDETVPARENLDECAEFFHRDNAPLISLADLDLAGHAAYHFLPALHRLAACRVDVDRAVVFDVNFGASLRHDALDRLATWTDKRADFLRVDLDCLDPRRVLRQLWPRLVDPGAHDLEYFRARFFCAKNGFGHDLVTDAGKFQVELITGDAGVRAAQLEIHVAEMIFGTDDVGEQFIPFQLSIFAVFSDKADRNSCDRRFDGHTGVHQREHPAANARHRCRSVRFHNFAGDTNGVTKIVCARHDWFERALRQRSVANLAPARTAGPPGFAYAEWRKIVMQNEPLRLFAAAVSIDHLRFFDRRECGEGERLGLAALENCRTMRARENADLARDRAQLLIAPTVDTFLLVQNADAERFLLHVIERLRDRELVGLGMFFQDRHLHFFAERIDCFCPRNFALGVERAFNPIAADSISNLEQILIHLEQRHLALRLANLCGELFLNPDHFARMLMGKVERLHEISFGNFPGRAFDHDNVVLSSDINQIEVALFALRMRRVRDELPVDATDADSTDRSGKRNVGNAKCCRRAVERENIGIVFAVRAQEKADDLGIVEITLWKERPERPIDHARGERFLFGRSAFALEIASREFPHRGGFFAVIDREREIILTFLDNCG